MATILFFECLIFDYKPYPQEAAKFLASFYTDLLGLVNWNDAENLALFDLAYSL